MEDPARDVGTRDAVFGDEALHVAAQILQHHLGDVGGEHDGEASVADVPAHDIFGIAVEGGARGENARAGGNGRCGQLDVIAGDHHGGSAIGEQAGGDEVSD